ncbi:MAG: TldD/PmbA family protein [Nitrospirae bacterium]|nr:TldD/PmbA family protein [Nitrospirota bacterium]
MRIDQGFLEDILEYAKKASGARVEVFALNSRTLNVEVRSQEVENIDVSESTGYAIRVIKNNRLGFAYSTDLSNYKDVVDQAITTSDMTTEDPFNDISVKETIPEVEIYDKEIAVIDRNTAIDLVLEIESSAIAFDKRIKKVRKAGGSFTESELYILNSNGVNHHFQATSCTAHITLAAEDNGDAQMGWGYEGSRRLQDIDFKRIGLEAAQRAINLLGARKAETRKTFVLLDSSVASEFLSVLSASFSADNVQKGKSLLIGKKGQKVVSEKINIKDNALLPYHLGTRPLDAEGTPSRENILVESGILREYLYNIYTARKDSTQSTGNATRAGIFTPPSVGASNLYIEASSDEYKHSFDGLLKLMPHGIVVTEAMGVHTANPITGEFSFGITGLWVENGEIKYPVKEAAISGTMLEFFSRIAGIGDEIRFYGKIGSPHLLVEDVDISG